MDRETRYEEMGKRMKDTSPTAAEREDDRDTGIIDYRKDFLSCSLNIWHVLAAGSPFVIHIVRKKIHKTSCFLTLQGTALFKGLVACFWNIYYAIISIWEGILRRKTSLVIPATSYSLFTDPLWLFSSSCVSFLVGHAGQTDHMCCAEHCSQHVFWISLLSALCFQGPA